MRDILEGEISSLKEELRAAVSCGTYMRPSRTVEVSLLYWRVPATNAGTVASTRTNPLTATAGCSPLCRAKSQVLYRATCTTQPAL